MLKIQNIFTLVCYHSGAAKQYCRKTFIKHKTAPVQYYISKTIWNILYLRNLRNKTVLLRDRKRRTARAPHLQKFPKCLSNFLSIFCPKLCPFFVPNFVQHFCPNLGGGTPRCAPPPSWGGYPRECPPSWGVPPGAPPSVGGYPRGHPPQLGGYPRGRPPGCPPVGGYPRGHPPSWGGTPGVLPQVRGYPRGCPPVGGTPGGTPQVGGVPPGRPPSWGGTPGGAPPPPSWGVPLGRPPQLGGAPWGQTNWKHYLPVILRMRAVKSAERRKLYDRWTMGKYSGCTVLNKCFWQW